MSFHHNIHTARRFKTEILILTLCFTSLRKIDLQKKMTNTWHLSTTLFLSILWSMHPHHPKKNKLRTTPLNFELAIYHPLCNLHEPYHPTPPSSIFTVPHPTPTPIFHPVESKNLNPKHLANYQLICNTFTPLPTLLNPHPPK